MMSSSGKKYNCYLPTLSEIENKDKEGNVTTISISSLLEPLASTCLYRLTGWWTYEICHRKHIKQFHQTADGSVDSAVYFLGKWEAEESDEPTEPEGIPTTEKIEYYSEFYSHGTVCDLTNLPRTTEVRFYCSNDKTHVSDLKEPSSCNYVVSVRTPLLCQHPAYRPKEQFILEINCYPHDEEPISVANIL